MLEYQSTNDVYAKYQDPLLLCIQNINTSNANARFLGFPVILAAAWEWYGSEEAD